MPEDSRQLPRQNTPHRVVLEFDDGCHARLVCPDDGSCQPAQVCGECYRHVDDAEKPPCDACPRPEDTGCWLKSWFDNSTYDELMHGKVTVEIDAEWNGDYVIASIVEPAEVAPGA
jgi:hypothetical protein